MANIRVDSAVTIFDGQTLTFKSPADCSQVTGLIVYYPDRLETASKVFQLTDANGNNVGNINNLFAADAIVKVVLDVDESKAFVQNADTNAYLEAELAKKYSPNNRPTAADVGAQSALRGRKTQTGWYNYWSGGAGWCRIAQFVCDNTEDFGGKSPDAVAGGCEIILRRRYLSKYPEFHHICLVNLNKDSSKDGTQLFVPLLSRTMGSGSHLYQKIRYVKAPNGKAYIDVYYNYSSQDHLHVTITNSDCSFGHWETYMIGRVADEVGEGESITGTLDIPANALPLTNLDGLKLNGSNSMTGNLYIEKDVPKFIAVDTTANLAASLELDGNLTRVKTYDYDDGGGSFHSLLLYPPSSHEMTDAFKLQRYRGGSWDVETILHTGNAASIIQSLAENGSLEVGKRKQASGSYTGNGNDSRTIELPFEPFIVVMTGTINGGYASALLFQGIGIYFKNESSTMSSYGAFLNGTTISFKMWFNENGKAATYFAIG